MHLFIESIIRIKLPSKDDFKDNPDEDAYSRAFSKAIEEAEEKIPGFEIVFINQHRWIVDQDGMTLVNVHCVDPKNTIVYLTQIAQYAQGALEFTRNLINRQRKEMELDAQNLSETEKYISGCCQKLKDIKKQGNQT
jgi:hypothetical protein